MHNLVPRLIIEEYARHNTRGAFPAVGLFVDISGFSQITDALQVHGQHGAEILAVVMGRIFNPLVESVYAYGGFIVGFAGDAFTALFPLDGPRAGRRARALAAAWRIQQQVTEAAKQATPYGTFSISAKAGLAGGEAVWGIVSSDDGGRAAYYFRGSAVEDCALAEHQAGPGEIIVEAGLLDQVNGLFTAEPVGDEPIFCRVTALIDSLPEPETVELPDGDAELMSRFFPANIVEQDFPGEFRQVVQLFISLPTVRTEEQLAIFMRSLFVLQDRYGGLLSHLDFGDKGANLLLFWGVPAAHENDIDRALSLLLALQTLTSMPISAGVTYTTGHAGYIGSPLRENYTCYGPGVNLAARFMVAAPRGEIWLDERVASRASHRYEIDFEDEMTFKGFSTPQKVYALIERKEIIENLFEGEMIGRRAELDRLTGLTGPLSRGQYAGFVAVVGEAGVGKSRLVYAFQTGEMLASLDHSWAYCPADQTLRQSLNPFRHWLGRYFGQSDAQTEARNKRNFNRKLDGLIGATEPGDLVAELDRTRSFLGALLDLHWPDSLYAQVDPQTRIENTFGALITLIMAESKQQPLILDLADVQWIDDYSVELLRRLVRTLSEAGSDTYPLAIVATARLEDTYHQIKRDLAPEEISLSGLSESDLAALTGELLGGPPAADLLALVVNRAEGNPFFAEQILRHLQEGSWLDSVDGRWKLKQAFDTRPLPTDVRALLVARLDRLAQEVREIVQTAAVLGREFELQLLSTMLQDGEVVAQLAERAEQAGIWTLLSQIRYMFKHGLLQEAAYRMQVHTRRRALHGLAAESIATLYAGDLRPHYGELAYHYEKAGILLAAADNYLLAGRRAYESGAMAESAVHYGRALAIIPADDTRRRWRALYGRQVASYVLGDQAAAQADTGALLQLAREVGDKSQLAEAYYLSASLAENFGDDKGALAGFEEALNIARAAGDRRIVAQTLGVKVGCHVRLGQMEAAQDTASEALAAAEALGDDLVLSRTLNNVAIYTMAAGDYSRAVDALTRQVAITGRLGELVGQTFGLLNLAYSQMQLGLYQPACETARRSLRQAESLGALREQAYNHLNLCLSLLRLGESAGAYQALEAARPLLQKVGDTFGRVICDTYLGLLLEVSGNVVEAAEAFKVARMALADLGITAYEADAIAGQARCALALGQTAAAGRQAQELWAYLVEHGADGMEFPIMAYHTCAQVFEASEDRARSRLVIEAGYDELIKRADRISDRDWRRAFLENVPEHRDLITMWQELS